MRRAGLVLVVALLVAGCGGDDGVDGRAVQAEMPDFVVRFEPQFPGLELPAWESSERVLIAPLPSAVDPDELCDVLARFLRGRKLEDVPLRVSPTVFSKTVLAEGDSTDGCDPA
jgi:hypothetical protein